MSTFVVTKNAPLPRRGGLCTYPNKQARKFLRLHPMLEKIVFGALLTLFATISQADNKDIELPTGGSAYLQDNRGVVARSASGLCWRTGHWTPADAVCDGLLLPPVARPTAPSIIPAPMAQVQQFAPEAPPPRCDFTLVLQGEEGFAFDRATLSETARNRPATELVPAIGRCRSVDAITITGHTDHLGSVATNIKISRKRAEAVANFLHEQGVKAPLETIAAGASQPAQTCNQKLVRTQLIRRLAPNRRVVVEVRGMAG